MQINKKSRRTSALPTDKAKKATAEGSRTRTEKSAARKPERAAVKTAVKTADKDALERRLRDELEGTGAPTRVRDIVARLLGDERSPGVEAMIARLQKAARSETVSPYGA